MAVVSISLMSKKKWNLEKNRNQGKMTVLPVRKLYLTKNTIFHQKKKKELQQQNPNQLSLSHTFSFVFPCLYCKVFGKRQSFVCNALYALTLLYES